MTITISLLEKAISIAEDAHKDQVDLAGQPYIDHIRMVVDLVSIQTLDLETLICAYLHDVVEDTSITYEDLVDEGFPKSTIEILQQISRTKGTPYKEYIANITNEKAKIVKVSDLLHNQDDSRLPVEKRNKDRKQKYHDAIDTLVGDVDVVSVMLDIYESKKK